MESHGASCGGAERPGIFGQLHKISNRTVSGDRVSWLQNSLHQNGVEATQGEAGKDTERGQGYVGSRDSISKTACPANWKDVGSNPSDPACSIAL